MHPALKVLTVCNHAKPILEFTILLGLALPLSLHFEGKMATSMIAMNAFVGIEILLVLYRPKWPLFLVAPRYLSLGFPTQIFLIQVILGCLEVIRKPVCEVTPTSSIFSSDCHHCTGY